ncbi:calcium-binding protein [Richelia sinica FACHB-800]|nr:calcium-binding protein [Richelia sinica FACHB-800]
MSLLLNSALTLTYNKLTAFSSANNFWQVLNTAFGQQYNRSVAEILRLQWQGGDFSQLPQIEVIDSSILGSANGAYASSTNKIYLSNSFVATATSAAISAVLLEEIGHFVDAHINLTDSAGDEGAIFAELVQGNSLDAATLEALQRENDHATITVNGEIVQIEQQDFTGTAGNETITGTSENDNIYGLEGNDTLNGGDGQDRIEGGDGNDLLSGGGGDDGYYFDYFGLYGGDGNDTLNGEAGNDELYGGNGNDILNGGSEDDYLDGGAGSDIIDGGSGSDTLYLDYSAQITPITIAYTDTQVVTSGVGDTFKAIEGVNLLSGSGADNLNFIATSVNSTIQGGIGNDFIALGSGNDSLYGQDGNDTLNSGGGQDRIEGGDGNDLLSGGGGDDGYYFDYFGLYGGDGNDTLNGEAGNDELYGGNGNDILNGGSEDDYLDGGAGSDIIDGGSGSDTLYLDYSAQITPITIAYTDTQVVTSGVGDTFKAIEGVNLLSGSGADNLNFIATSVNSTIQGGIGNDFIALGSGNDSLYGQDGNDTLNSGGGQDRIEGGDGNDLLSGGGGDDGYYFDYFGLYGGDGNDTLNGEAGNDELYGGNGNDLLQGTNGGVGELEYLEGGLGSDRFILGDTTWIGYDDGDSTTNGDSDYAEIADFNPTEGDVIQLQGGLSYLLNVVDADTQLLLNKPGTEPDELIAIIRNQTGLSLTGSYFAYKSLPTNITLTVSPSSVLEDGTTNLIYTFTRTGNIANALTVNYNIGGTATFNTDYTQTSATSFTGTTGSITFAAGSSTKTLTIDPTADTTLESNETVALTLAAGSGYTIGTTTAVTGTITNDDTRVTLAVAPSSVNEDGTTNLVYTFTRTGSTTNALTVNYSIAGTADSSDYTGATPGTGKTITFAAGASTATLTIDPTADNTFESNETVALTLATGTGYTVGTTTAVTGTITNDDPLPIINLSSNQTIVEGLTSPQNVSYTVTLSNPSSQTITVNYATANGTATAGSDYTSTSGILTFNPGVTSQVINIPILNDSINEANESITLTLTNPTNASLGSGTTATTTITDTLTTSVTTTLPTNVENLTLTGTSAINGTGNAGNNVIRGNSGNNTLSGGNGNDTYLFVATTPLGTDTIVETTTGGIDTISFSGTTVATNINLGVTTSQTVNSNLKLILSANNVIENATGGTSNDRLTGNVLNNTLNGGDGNDQLQGLGGNDTLNGGNGNDVLTGGSGNDLLWGGRGDDILVGDTGNDQYQFKDTGVFSSVLGVDYISQFEVGLDKILLSKTTFSAISNSVGTTLTDFAFVTDDALVDASNARVVFSQSTGSLFYNQNGNVLGAAAVFEFARLGNPDITLGSSDFTLVA